MSNMGAMVNTEIVGSSEIMPEGWGGDNAELTVKAGDNYHRTYVTGDLDDWAELARRILAEVERRHAEPVAEDDPDDMSATVTGANRLADI